MALADISSWDELAERTPLSRSTLKDLGTVRGRATEAHLRVIAAACDLPYAWFTVPDLGAAIADDAEHPSLTERLEAVERQLLALTRREPIRAGVERRPPAAKFATGGGSGAAPAWTETPAPVPRPLGGQAGG